MMKNVDDFKMLIWNQFCERHGIRAHGTSLFRCSKALNVSTINIGEDLRPVLRRSASMEDQVISEVRRVISDFNSKGEVYDGLIYMMYREVDKLIVPLYIGKSEKFGKSGNLSTNIKNIRTNRHYFCRWGNNYAYHIGDLSAVVLGHKKHQTAKYENWAKALFKSFPTLEPELRFDTRFWIKAWKSEDVGIWKEFGATSLTFLEYLLIGVASSLFPNELLNTEGVNRNAVSRK